MEKPFSHLICRLQFFRPMGHAWYLRPNRLLPFRRPGGGAHLPSQEPPQMAGDRGSHIRAGIAATRPRLLLASPHSPPAAGYCEGKYKAADIAAARPCPLVA